MHLFCFGLGYSALPIAKAMQAQGWRVSGTSRSEDKCAILASKGFAMYRWQAGDQFPDEARCATHLLSSIAPEESGDPMLQALGGEVLPELQWAGYFSSTGVYGDHNGAWVDETVTPMPNSARAQRRLEAEQAWLESGFPVNVFRLAGIYGPGRNVLTRVVERRAQRVDSPVYFSRIHQADIAQSVLAAIAQKVRGEVFNCADDEPARQADVVEYGCQLLGMEPPPLQTVEVANLSEIGRSFYANNRRIGNNKLKEKLGIRLQFPNYRVGLEELVKG